MRKTYTVVTFVLSSSISLAAEFELASKNASWSLVEVKHLNKKFIYLKSNKDKVSQTRKKMKKIISHPHFHEDLKKSHKNTWK